MPINMQRSFLSFSTLLLPAITVWLMASTPKAVSQILPSQQIASIELENRPTLFSYPLDVTNVRVPNNYQYRRTDYRFTIDIPEAAEQPLQTVTFSQVEGADYPRFSERRSRAYEAGDRNQTLDISVDDDWDDRTVTVTFEPPVAPGRQITIALNAQNPRDGIYIYEVTAAPPNTEGSGQRIGIERLNFYQGSERRYRR